MAQQTSGTRPAVRAPSGEVLTDEERQRIEEYTRRVLSDRDRPRPPRDPEAKRAQREEKLRERLERTEVRLEATDQRRMQLLISTAKLHADRGNPAGVYACAVELAYLARTVSLGVQRAHPVPEPQPPRAVAAHATLPDAWRPEGGE